MQPARTISKGEIHVWRLQLDADEHSVCKLHQVLDPNEQERAHRFRSDRDRIRFVTARAGLRCLLSGYGGIPPQSLRFHYGEQGKPELPDSGLTFNLSHSAGEAIYVITREARIGVDIEQIRPMHDAHALARRFFAPSEIGQLQQYQPDDANNAFFRCWTRKESYMKGEGKGLSMALSSFAVSLEAGDARLLYPEEASLVWHLKDLAAPAGFVACLAVDAPITTICNFRAEEVCNELTSKP